MWDSSRVRIDRVLGSSVVTTLCGGAVGTEGVPETPGEVGRNGVEKEKRLIN